MWSAFQYDGPVAELPMLVGTLGPPGVGKTHLAISLAINAAESSHKIYFRTLTDLVDSLEEAKAAGRLNRRLNTLHPPGATGAPPRS